MKKGSRVRFKSGPKAGVSGSIFWTGKDKYKGGQRFGIRGDDGETHWASDSEVEPSDAPEPEVDEGEKFEKGDRVRYRDRSNTSTGSVFWVGDSRQGGQRLGIRDDHDPDNAVWLDAHSAERLDEADDEGPPPQAQSNRRSRGRPQSGGATASGRWSDDDPAFDNTAEAMLGAVDGQILDAPTDLPSSPPMDDSYLESLAATVDDDVPF